VLRRNAFERTGERTGPLPCRMLVVAPRGCSTASSVPDKKPRGLNRGDVVYFRRPLAVREDRDEPTSALSYE
jgi:hypothetical protein